MSRSPFRVLDTRAGIAELLRLDLSGRVTAVADLKTTVTELITGLGMTGHETLESALDARPKSMVSVAPERWTELRGAYDGGALKNEFDSAFFNGRAFFEASDGLRGRVPQLVEWKGAQKSPGDEVLPIDLRIDHVFLISCKYLSKILHNASPSRVFDHALRTTRFDGSVDWFDHVARDEHSEFYKACVAETGVNGLAPDPCDLSAAERKLFKDASPKSWSQDVEQAYKAMCVAVSNASAQRLQDLLKSKAEQEAILRRMLRFGQAPYFVLGNTAKESLRVRVATPWDWQQQFELRKFEIEPRDGGQPMVTWRALVRGRHSGAEQLVEGHIEIRWSHGRFGGKPEAKVYLDTPHAEVPGYFPLI
jgi:hypothetical protein